MYPAWCPVALPAFQSAMLADRKSDSYGTLNGPYVFPELGLPVIHTPERCSDSFDFKLGTVTIKLPTLIIKQKEAKSIMDRRKDFGLWQERVKVSDH